MRIDISQKLYHRKAVFPRSVMKCITVRGGTAGRNVTVIDTEGLSLKV